MSKVLIGFIGYLLIVFIVCGVITKVCERLGIKGAFVENVALLAGLVWPLWGELLLISILVFSALWFVSKSSSWREKHAQETAPVSTPPSSPPNQGTTQ